MCDELSDRAGIPWLGTGTDTPHANVSVYALEMCTCSKQFGKHLLLDCDRSSAVSVLGHEGRHTSLFLLFTVINLVSRNAWGIYTLLYIILRWWRRLGNFGRCSVLSHHTICQPNVRLSVLRHVINVIYDLSPPFVTIFASSDGIWTLSWKRTVN